MKKMLMGCILAFMLFAGCAGVSDIVEKLPNGYVYGSESMKQKWIMKNPLSVDSDLYVPCTVKKYKYNQHYIIAKIKFHYDMNYGTIGFKESKELKEGGIYYYIIDTVNHVRYGAFDSYEMFTQKLKDLNVNLSLDK